MQYREEESDSLGNATRTNRRGVALDLFFLSISLSSLFGVFSYIFKQGERKKEVEEMIKETRGRAVVVEMMMMMMMPDESVPIESQPTATTTTTSPDYRREKYEKKKRKENECNSALHKSRRILCDARLSLSLYPCHPVCTTGSEQLKDIKV
jgi:hypothetical protein